jgi:hypothetical protein
VVRPSWGEDGSVIQQYKCYWALPAVPLWDRSPAEFETISYGLVWDWVPFLSPPTSHRATVELLRAASHLHVFGTDLQKTPLLQAWLLRRLPGNCCSNRVIGLQRLVVLPLVKGWLP